MRQFLPFMLGAERYALKLTSIQEVVDGAILHYLPATPPTFLGAINVHGQVVPVVDLARLLGFEPAPICQRFIVLSPQIFTLALAVHQVESVVNADLQQLVLMQSDEPQNCIGGVINGQEKMISLLDLEQLRKIIEAQLKPN